MAQLVNNPPAMWEIWIHSLGWEDPLGKGKATHSSILAWRIPWTEEAGGLQSMGSQKVGQDCATNTSLPCLVRQILIHCTTREVLNGIFKQESF